MDPFLYWPIRQPPDLMTHYRIGAPSEDIVCYSLGTGGLPVSDWPWNAPQSTTYTTFVQPHTFPMNDHINTRVTPDVSLTTVSHRVRPNLASYEGGASLKTLSNRTRRRNSRRREKGRVDIRSRTNREVNLSAKWAQEHPEILTDFFNRKSDRLNSRERGSVKIKTLRSRTQKLLVREKNKQDTRSRDSVPERRRPTIRPSSTSAFVPISPEFQLITPIPAPRESTQMSSPKEPPVSSIKSSDRSPIKPDMSRSPVKPPENPVRPPVSSIRRFLPDTNEDQINKYEPVVGELKEAIARYAGQDSSEGERYIKPSDIAHELNRKIPPVIPPPPPIDLAGPTFAAKPLRHVSPPVTPQLGRVIDRAAQPKREGLHEPAVPDQTYTNLRDPPPVKLRSDEGSRDPTAASTQDRIPFPKREHDSKQSSYETEILKYLPEHFADGQSKYLASDGTEWEVIVVKPHEDELAVLNRILAQQNGGAAQNQSPVHMEDMADILKNAGELDVNAIEAA